MSFQAEQAVLDSEHRELFQHPHLKLLLAVLARFARHDDGSVSYPGVAKLMKKTGQALRTVRRNLRELERLGFIRRGNQNHVAKVPVYCRPVVYNVNLSLVRWWQTEAETAATQSEYETTNQGVPPVAPVPLVAGPGATGGQKGVPPVAPIETVKKQRTEVESLRDQGQGQDEPLKTEEPTGLPTSEEQPSEVLIPESDIPSSGEAAPYPESPTHEQTLPGIDTDRLDELQRRLNVHELSKAIAGLDLGLSDADAGPEVPPGEPVVGVDTAERQGETS